MTPLVPGLMAHVSSAMTHLVMDVRASACSFLDLLVQHYPALVVSSFAEQVHILTNWNQIRFVNMCGSGISLQGYYFLITCNVFLRQNSTTGSWICTPQADFSIKFIFLEGQLINLASDNVSLLSDCATLYGSAWKRWCKWAGDGKSRNCAQ